MVEATQPIEKPPDQSPKMQAPIYYKCLPEVKQKKALQYWTTKIEKAFSRGAMTDEWKEAALLALKDVVEETKRNANENWADVEHQVRITQE